MRVCLKLVSALIMGLAITGMHYAGMFAAIFTHLDHAHGTTIAMDPILLSIFITTIVISILLVALILSTTRYLYVTTVKNKTDFLMAVLNNMWGGVVACDATGKITLANRVATELFGDMEKLESAQWLEKNPMILNKTGKKAKLEEYPLYRALHGENVRDIEVVAKDQLGERHILVVDGQALVSAADGEKLGAVVVWNDISKSTAAEESSKAKSSFLANMSHEIRTPLNGVMGMLQIIMATPLNEKQKGLVQKSLDCSNSLLEILGDILDFSKIEAGKVALENISFDLKQELGALMTINEVQCAKKKLK
jgi:signal transduction histidine kinase